MLTKCWKSELLLATNFGSLCPKVTNFGSQNFGYQIWFCTRLLWYSGVPRTANLLKISSDIENYFREKWLFRHTAHRFESWIEFLWLLLTNLHENAFDTAAGSRNAWRLPTELAGGGILCNGAWKSGQDSHTAVFSQWVLVNYTSGWHNGICIII